MEVPTHHRVLAPMRAHEYKHLAHRSSGQPPRRVARAAAFKLSRDASTAAPRALGRGGPPAAESANPPKGRGRLESRRSAGHGGLAPCSSCAARITIESVAFGLSRDRNPPGPARLGLRAFRASPAGLSLEAAHDTPRTASGACAGLPRRARSAWGRDCMGAAGRAPPAQRRPVPGGPDSGSGCGPDQLGLGQLTRYAIETTAQPILGPSPFIGLLPRRYSAAAATLPAEPGDPSAGLSSGSVSRGSQSSWSRQTKRSDGT
jgi:hypothetical protein